MDLNKAKQNAKDLNNELDETQSKFGDLRDTLGSINSELGKKINRVKDASKAYTTLGSIAQKFQSQEEGLSRLSDKQIKQLQEKAKIQVSEIARASELLATDKTRAATGKDIFSLNGAAFNQTLKSLVEKKKITSEEEALIRAKKSGFEVENKTLELIAKEAKTRQDVNKAMGVAGGILKGLNEIGGSFAKAFKLDEVATDMEEFADESIRAEGSVSRLAVLGVGLKSAFKNFGDTLTDPSVIFGALMKGFTAVEKEQQNFRRLTGQSADAFRGINGSLTTTSEYLAGMVTLTKELGVNANVVFSPENVTTVAELTANMGMAGKEAANLAALSKVSGTNLQGNLKSTEGQFQNFVKTNKVALNFGQVLSGVANASDSVKLSLGGSQEAIGEAVMEAQKLGLTLDQVDKIADSLLNFQSSIEAEMEAELLTGQAINLEKARELALNNDLAGVAKEIGNNQAVLQAFSSGNRKAQEATAKAMGMTREEMSGMILQQKLSNNLSVEQAAAAAGISVEEAQRLTTQQQITKSIEKMTQALAPVIGFFASLLSNSMVLYTVIGALATVYATKLVVSISNTLTMLGLQTAAQEADNASKIKGTLISIKDTAVKYASIAATAAWNAITFIGTSIQNSSILATIRKGAILVATTAYKYASIAAQVTWNAVVGAGNLIMAAGNALMNIQIGRYIALNAQKLIDTIRTWAGVGATFAQAGANATLSTSQKILGTTGAAAGGGMAAAGVGLGAFGAAAAPAIPIILAIGAALLMASPAIYAFSFVIEALGKVIVGVMSAIPPIITAIADGFVAFLGAITMEKAATLPLVGLGLMALAGGVVALAAVSPFLPFAALSLVAVFGALSLLQGVDLEAVFTPISNLATLAPQLLMLGGGLMTLATGGILLGLASPVILTAAIALTALSLPVLILSQSNFGALTNDLSILSSLAPGLLLTSGALFALAGGLAAVGVASLLAIPAMAAMSLFGVMGGEESSGESSSGESSKEDGGMAKINANLEKLIALISAGGDVYIDGAKVGKTIQLSSSKMG